MQFKLGWSTFCVYLQQTGHFVHLELGCSYNAVHPLDTKNKHIGRLKMQNVTRQEIFQHKAMQQTINFIQLNINCSWYVAIISQAVQE